MKFGVTGRESHTCWIPLIIFGNMGMNVKVVPGYKGAAEQIAAIARGEIEAVVTGVTSAFTAWKAGLVRPICLLNNEKQENLPDVPTIFKSVRLTPDTKVWCDRVAATLMAWRSIITSPGYLRIEFGS